MTMWTDYLEQSVPVSAGDFARPRRAAADDRVDPHRARSAATGTTSRSPTSGSGREAAHPEPDQSTPARHLRPHGGDCMGASVILHVIETEYGGEAVRGIRIKTVVPRRRPTSLRTLGSERSRRRTPAARSAMTIPF